MPRKAPDVLSGPRGPQDFPERPADYQAEAVNVVKKKPTERVFQSKFPNFRLQLWAAKDSIIDGRVIEGDRKAAMFEAGIYRTSDPRAIEIIENSPGYGVGRDFWDAEELAHQTREAQKDAAKQTILKDKELLREMVKSGQLTKADLDDFSLEATA